MELLGQGGFGEVWKARNPHFDGIAPVALKFCLDPAAKERLLKHEAHIINQVMRQGRHEGIVPLLRTYLNADPPCLEYEYIDGGDLSDLLARAPSRRLDLAVLLRIAREVAAGLAEINRLGMTHRDVTPRNILLT